MKKLLSALLIFNFLLFSYSLNGNAQNRLKIDYLNSLSAAAIDCETGRVLYEKEGYKLRPMASTTKIMTLILALEYGDLDSYVTVSNYAAKMPEVRLGIKAGEQYKLKDLLYAMIMESYNDCAVAIAEHISGSVEQFAELMNQKAYEIGLNNTYFITPNGLDATDDNGTHSTNAVELALLMRYCVQLSEESDMFISICQTKTYEFKDYSNKRSVSVRNKNQLLFERDDVLAGKTGFTGNAGYCYVCALKNDNSFVIISLLGCGWPPNKSFKWNDVLHIWQYISDGYEIKEILNQNTYYDEIFIYNGFKNIKIPVGITDSIRLYICETDRIDISTNYNNIVAPINRGEQVGYIDIKVNGIVVRTVPCYACDSVHNTTYYSIVRLIFNRFFLTKT